MIADDAENSAALLLLLEEQADDETLAQPQLPMQILPLPPPHTPDLLADVALPLPAPSALVPALSVLAAAVGATTASVHEDTMPSQNETGDTSEVPLEPSSSVPQMTQLPPSPQLSTHAQAHEHPSDAWNSSRRSASRQRATSVPAVAPKFPKTQTTTGNASIMRKSATRAQAPTDAVTRDKRSRAEEHPINESTTSVNAVIVADRSDAAVPHMLTVNIVQPALDATSGVPQQVVSVSVAAIPPQQQPEAIVDAPLAVDPPAVLEMQATEEPNSNDFPACTSKVDVTDEVPDEHNSDATASAAAPTENDEQSRREDQDAASDEQPRSDTLTDARVSANSPTAIVDDNKRLDEAQPTHGLTIDPHAVAAAAVDNISNSTNANSASAADATTPQLLLPPQSPSSLALASAATENASAWIACSTDAGEAYYYNALTHESRWTLPSPTTATHRSASTADNVSPVVADPASTADVTSIDALFAAAAGVEPFALQLESLLHAGASVGTINSAGMTLLQVACQSSNVHAASLLLYYGASPYATGAHSTLPPLHLACWSNHVALVQLLLDWRVPVTATDAAHNSVLHVCAAAKSIDALVLLLNHIVRFDAQDPGSLLRLLNVGNQDGDAPLHVAVKSGSADIVRVLLERGAAIDVDDAQGRTPLVLAVMENQIECVQLLQAQQAAAHTAPSPNSSNERDGSSYEPVQESVAINEQPLVDASHVTPSTGDTPQSTPREVGNEGKSGNDVAVQQRIQELADELTVAKQETSDSNDRLDQLGAENAQLVAAIDEERAERMNAQTMLEAQALTLSTLRAAHDALASRCGMLDSIARGAQEKLQRERIEHSQSQALLESHVRSSMDENAQLVAALNHLESEWTERLALQQQQQQQQQEEAANDERMYADAKHVGGPRTNYYSENDSDVKAASRDNAGAQQPTYAYDPRYYRADATDASTLVDESTAFYYPQADTNDDNDDMDDADDDANEQHYEQDDDESLAGARTVTPQMSPTRVGAVWNRFFENMTGVAEPSDTQQQQKQQHLNSSSRSGNRAPVAAAPPPSPSSVFMAIRKSDLAQLQQLLLRGVSPNVRDAGEKGTPLHLACELGDLDAMQLLCEFAADIEVRDEREQTPLLVACSQGHFECVKFLLQSAADLGAVNASGDSALHLAAWDGSAECIEILAEYGVDPLERNRIGLSPLENLRTRSPLRHKFDDLADNHPMRQALLLLEELEQQALTAMRERQRDSENDENDDSGSDREHAADNDTPPNTRRRTSREQQQTSSNDTSASYAAAPQKHMTVDESQTNQTTGDSSKSTSSWKDWLFGFASGKNEQQTRQQQPQQQPYAPLNSAADNHTDQAKPNRRESSTISEFSDNDSSSDVSDDGALLIARRHEPLQPPPEIEAELQRAKLQLERPAVPTSRTSMTQQHENDDDNDSMASSRSETKETTPQTFVAADLTRLHSMPAMTPSSAAQHVRSRYVDTFNTM